MRILVLSHHHPEIVAGGAERAAYSLFRALKSDPRVGFAGFVAGASSDFVGHSAYFGCFRGRPDEIIVSLPPVDDFTLESRDLAGLRVRVTELVRHLRPDVVHLHHVLFWGIETLELFAELGVPVVLTLHEFVLICQQHGQMLKTNGELCHEATPAECNRCFPGYSAGKFFVRRAILCHLLKHVGALIAPSRFLADRFQHWLGSAERIVVIENILGHRGACEREEAETKSKGSSNRKRVIAFFGQINPFKGVDILFEAYSLLSEPVRDALDVRIYGENKHWLGGDFERRLSALFEDVDGGVRKFGAYRNEDAVKLMQGCDWIVVPSVWWENAPVVIQEAKLAGCGVICSDIGGMVEKTDETIDLRFPAGNAPALAAILEEIAHGAHVLDGDTRNARSSEVAAMRVHALESHIAVYQSFLSAPPDRIRKRTDAGAELPTAGHEKASAHIGADSLIPIETNGFS